MRTQTDFYHSFRCQQPDMPETVARIRARHAGRVEQWASRNGFNDYYWHGRDHERGLFHTRWLDFEKWTEAGYDMQAWIDIDANGWDAFGPGRIGRFQSDWQSGAIKHERLGNQTLEWFVPIDMAQAQALYARACAYGATSEYLTVTVIVSHAGVMLNKAAIGGIASDRADSDYLTRTVFDLNCEVSRYVERSQSVLAAPAEARVSCL